jgi:acetyl-CoA carboxylase biotin carboxyl carrier protein
MAEKDDKIKKLEQLIELMKKNELVELEIENDDEKIMHKRAQPQQTQVTAMPMMQPMMHGATASPAAAPAGSPQTAAPSNLIEIKAPMVGTFYATPTPDAEPYVEVGSKVSQNTVVCIVEAMKVMNEIKAETEGAIAEVCVKSGQAVEYGTVLFRVKPE